MARDPHGMYTPPAPGTIDREFVTDCIPGPRPDHELEWLREFEAAVRAADAIPYMQESCEAIEAAIAELDRKRRTKKGVRRP